ncbi:MAG: hypothetical protein VYC56_01955 [Actinomycetota bacterium]|nr:hypothetical protein [Actinomycetota bacterium]MEC9394455.1 hypothetical protein [Actinomycetota bacterium]MEE2957443.1 hypothetical protein [Actinomycetota bacterium]
MADTSSVRLLGVMDALDALAREGTPAEAAAEMDPAVLQAFWREWPHVSVWAGNLWRELNRDLEAPAEARQDREVDEVGGSG